MPYAFNPFTGTFDFYKAITGFVSKAKAPLKITGEEVELEEGQLTNAYIKAAAGIEESKLSLPEVIIKTTSQTITGQKTVESATPPEEAKQTNAKEPLIFVFGNGNVNTLVVANASGGNGAEFKLKTGAGGRATNATIKNTGGTGGRIIIETGNGGNATQEAGIKNLGGNAGLVEVRSGIGGTAAGATTAEQTGGNGGTYTFRAGGGGPAITGTGVNKGGKGGPISFITGEGGRNEGTVAGSFGGAGGTLLFETGSGGESEVTKGKGGPVQFVLGNGGGASEANSGAFTIYWAKAEAAKARFEITPEGLTKAKAGLTVEGALTLPAESITEGFYKKESVSKEKLAKAVQEELLKIETPTALGLYTNEKEEEEAKGTFVTAVVTLKAEAAAGTVKLVNSGKEQEYKWDGIALGAQKVQLTWMVKKAGKWKITFAGAVEKVEVSRVTMEP